MMADPVVSATPPQTPAPAVAAVPPAEPSPAATVTPAEAPVAAPVAAPSSVAAAPAPAPSTAAVVTPAEPTPAPIPAPAPTLLEKFDADKAAAAAAKAPQPATPAAGATGAASASATGATGAAAQPAPPATAAAPAPFEYKYTLPETIKMDDGLKGTVHKAFDDFRANPAEGAQALINLHEKQMQAFADHLVREQHRIFNETRQNWSKQVLADPEIGGAGHQTSMGAIARMRDLFVPESERPAFEEFLRVTGAGDHPQFLKLLHRAARYYDEPGMPPPNPRPPPGNGARPNRRLRDIYDHPRSSSEGRS